VLLEVVSLEPGKLTRRLLLEDGVIPLNEYEAARMRLFLPKRRCSDNPVNSGRRGRLRKYQTRKLRRILFGLGSPDVDAFMSVSFTNSHVIQLHGANHPCLKHDGDVDVDWLCSVVAHETLHCVLKREVGHFASTCLDAELLCGPGDEQMGLGTAVLERIGYDCGLPPCYGTLRCEGYLCPTGLCNSCQRTAYRLRHYQHGVLDWEVPVHAK